MNSINALNNSLTHVSNRSYAKKKPIPQDIHQETDSKPTKIANNIQAIQQYSQQMSTNKSVNAFNEGKQKISYSSSNAVNLYQTHNNLELKENTQLMFGLSVYA